MWVVDPSRPRSLTCGFGRADPGSTLPAAPRSILGQETVGEGSALRPLKKSSVRATCASSIAATMLATSDDPAAPAPRGAAIRTPPDEGGGLASTSRLR
jgi:hypothetical protein